ncbi:MAG: hypothetical protein IKJ77_00290 [Firmicutes bacterium]|nr:hypothetical protein [Bacillota bacterium]
MCKMNVPAWEEFESFVKLKIYDRLARDKKDYFEDVLQECYISYEEAKESYDDSQGKSFAGWFMSYYFYGAMQKAIYGGRTERIISDPVNTADRLDRPFGDDNIDDMTLADTIIDETAEPCLYRYTDLEFWNEVGRLIVEGAAKAGEMQKQIIKTMLQHDCGLKEAQRILGGNGEDYPKYARVYKNACDSIRRHITAHVLSCRGNSAIEEVISFRGTGLCAYKEHIFTSSVELLAIKRADKKRNAKDIGKLIKTSPKMTF